MDLGSGDGLGLWDGQGMGLGACWHLGLGCRASGSLGPVTDMLVAVFLICPHMQLEPCNPICLIHTQKTRKEIITLNHKP